MDGWLVNWCYSAYIIIILCSAQQRRNNNNGNNTEWSCHGYFAGVEVVSTFACVSLSVHASFGVYRKWILNSKQALTLMMIGARVFLFFVILSQKIVRWHIRCGCSGRCSVLWPFILNFSFLFTVNANARVSVCVLLLSVCRWIPCKMHENQYKQ